MSLWENAKSILHISFNLLRQAFSLQHYVRMNILSYTYYKVYLLGFILYIIAVVMWICQHIWWWMATCHVRIVYCTSICDGLCSADCACSHTVLIDSLRDRSHHWSHNVVHQAFRIMHQARLNMIAVPALIIIIDSSQLWMKTTPDCMGILLYCSSI